LFFQASFCWLIFFSWSARLDCWGLPLLVFFKFSFYEVGSTSRSRLQVCHASLGWLKKIYFSFFFKFLIYHWVILEFNFLIFSLLTNTVLFSGYIYSFKKKLVHLPFDCFFYYIIKWYHFVGPSKIYDFLKTLIASMHFFYIIKKNWLNSQQSTNHEPWI
jgi:hypothetical protein